MSPNIYSIATLSLIMAMLYAAFYELNWGLQNAVSSCGCSG